MGSAAIALADTNKPAPNAMILLLSFIINSFFLPVTETVMKVMADIDYTNISFESLLAL